ncbi:MAG: 3-deoxy-manno-octulosonate cytidylyltransferase [Alphaproteobacteria bacterium ADurb.BinA280]|nr:3-deoxy-manno-octulosonate cytidylyltransferase [Xanthomonadales bacterium]MCC6504536.1 3-deoxy-manno-octulosonate cytidylyltransferase [Aquimonas sp.]OPZ12159.1 MAG: 3-deoxy-manno-octulosonate cytidylyltransferase [Alphaproteobacteria bacterium ADurb.BinA280]
MTQPEFVVAIPARYGSTRLPGKPLRLIAGEPMIVHVARRAQEAGATAVVVATDDARIAAAVSALGLGVCMTSDRHVSGTDRLAETAERMGWTDDCIVVNLQGDEPLAPPSALREVAMALAQSGAQLTTLAQPIMHSDEIFDPNAVKVVCNAKGDALYFSRAALPWARDDFAQNRLQVPGPHWWRHIGLYAYRAGDLKAFAAMPPGRLEQIESLEQLRVLEAGWRIAVRLSPAPFPAGVDTEADLLRVEAALAAR